MKTRKATTKKSLVVNKNITSWRPSILSRHPSHNVLRAANKNLPLNRFPVTIRFGSTTPSVARVQINSVSSIRNSASKLLMKQCFSRAGVKTAEWCTSGETEKLRNIGFPLVAKSHYGSRGNGNTLIKTAGELESWKRGKNLGNYLFEKYMSFSLEYRLHVSEDGCFYTCRKALKKDAPEDGKWSRHDDNCVWLLETNPDFYKPNSWKEIVKDCVKALKAVGADVLSFDVKVQSSKDSNGRARTQDYILIECNSASSMDNGTGEISVCAKAYIEEIPKIIERKARQ